MPTQKLFKQRVRARMTRTGESYTSARQQLLRKSSRDVPAAEAPAQATPEDSATPTETLTSDAAMLRATGRRHAEWFALLDGWQANTRRHGEIATYLRDAQGLPGWWAQNVTVAYERARGLRAVGQMADGYQVAVTRTVATDAASALAAFTDPERRRAWLPVNGITPRPTRAARTARFDWADPPSRLVVTVQPKDEGRVVVAIVHEKLPDTAAADRLKASWRGWLGELKAGLER